MENAGGWVRFPLTERVYDIRTLKKLTEYVNYYSCIMRGAESSLATFYLLVCKALNPFLIKAYSMSLIAMCKRSMTSTAAHDSVTQAMPL